MRRIGQALVGMLLLSAGAVALAGAGSWSSDGPWGGVAYGMHVPSGPTGATNAYIVTRGGLFRTVDAGSSWVRADVGVPGGLALTAPLVIDDVATGTLTATDSRARLYRSTDSASTWVSTGFALDPELYLADLADVPGDSSGLFLAAGTTSSTPPAGLFLFKSVDGGASFAPSGTGLPDGQSWRVVAVHPVDANLVLVGTEGSSTGTTGIPAPPAIYRSEDGGATWSAAFSVPGAEDRVPRVTDIAFGAANTVYAAVDFTMWRSEDGGANWTGPYGDVEFILADPTTALSVLTSGFRGVQASVNGGTSFTPLNNGLSSNSSYLSTLDAQPRPDAVTGIAAESAWPAPGAALWVSTLAGGALRSLDNGATWTGRNSGIAAVNVRAVAVHPNPAEVTGTLQGARIYAGFGDAFQGSPGLLLSTDAGATWAPSNSQLRASQIRAIAIDPTTAGTVAGDVSSSHIYAAGGPIVIEGFFNSGLYKSTNGGITWTTLSGGLPTRNFGSQVAAHLGTVRNIVLDPRSCTIPLAAGPCASGPLLRVYATTTGSTVVDSMTGARTSTHRVIRSDDAGATWTDLDGNLPPSTVTPPPVFLGQSVTPLPLLLSPADPDVIYIGTFVNAGSADPAVLDDRPSGVFRTSDGGVTWQQRSTGLPRVPGFSNIVVDVLAMAIHPIDENTLWAATYDLMARSSVPPVHKSTDGGLTWTPSATGLPADIDLRALIVDPTDPDILYASGYYPSGDDGSLSFSNPPGVFRSDDGGATWLSISGGLQARSVLAMTLDPFQPHVLHLGTNTGVWSMEQVPDADGDGASDAMENFAPGGGDGDGDGEQDAVQNSVGSAVITFAAGRGAAQKGGGGFVTSKVQPVEGACAQSVDVEAVLAARYGRDYLADGLDYRTYPRDLLRFEVLDCQRAEVDLFFHGADFLGTKGWSFRMFGPATPGDDSTVGWHDLSARAQIVAPDRWRLTLDADETGSFRGTGDSILFMGGPACHDPRIFEDRFGDTTAAGCNN